ncbi:hypothetical protein FKX85_04795 [Echinicola soli]|uniref:PsbP C-terminal domain-containing protein n=1 Tax=Echinicola soli TaxID=2591634 RepID=A0A514CEZ2_9BACT|nr:hypothetical protein [Echinicola soli]QDH78392.1 hypothetical protein FKX85_04795 [Echinicola soli]
MIFRSIVLFFLGMLPLVVSAQDRVVVNDPSIQFSYVKPSGWEVKDDGYTYEVHVPSIDGAYVSFTYVQRPQGDDYIESLGDKPAFKEDFDFELMYNVADGVEGFEVIEQGKTQIDGTTALWAQFQSLNDGQKSVNYFYMYPKLGQNFKITTTVPALSADTIQKEFEEMIQTFEAKKR